MSTNFTNESYLNKINQVIDKLNETKFDIFNGDKTAATMFFTKNLTTFADAENAATQAAVQKQFLRGFLSPKEYREDIKLWEKDAELALSRAASGCKAINKMCNIMELGDFMPLDNLKEGISAFNKEMFENEVKNYNFEELVEQSSLMKAPGKIKRETINKRMTEIQSKFGDLLEENKSDDYGQEVDIT